MTQFYLPPVSVETDNGNFSLFGAATKPEALDDPFGLPDDSDGLTCGVDGQEIRFTHLSLPTVQSITSVSFVWFSKLFGTESGQQGRMGARLAGVNHYGAWYTFDTGGALRSDLFLTNPQTGVAWAQSDMTSPISVLGFRDLTGPIDSGSYIQCLFLVDAVATPAQIEAARHKASVMIRLRRRAPQVYSAQLPPYYADVAPFGNLSWSHYAIPTTADSGAGVANLYERRVCVRLGWKLNLNGKPYFRPRDFDLHDYSVRLWRTWHSREVPTQQKQGLAALDPGAGEVYDRAGTAWIENPAAARAGILQIVKVVEDQQRFSTDGLAIEPQRTNDALRSSYVNGLTGITTGGASTITADTTAVHLLFEAGESPNSLQFVAGNPHGSDGTAAHPVTAAYAASDRIVVSYYHKDDSGEAMAIRIQRSGGGSDYWNDSTGAWAAGPINNLMPVSASKYARWVSKVIDVGAGTPTITVTIVQPSGGTVSRVNRGGHLQIEKGRSATAPMVTQAATFTRNRDDFKFENFTGKVVYDPARVDLDIVFVPNWNSAEQDAAVAFEVWRAFKDASNFDRLFYSMSTGSFVFRRVVGGVTFDATFATAVTRGTAYTIGCRAISSNGEEGLAAHTLSIYVNGVKGTDGSPGSAWTLAANEYLYIGQTEAGANPADGHLRQLTSRPFIYADAEHVDYP